MKCMETKIEGLMYGTATRTVLFASRVLKIFVSLIYEDIHNYCVT